VHKCSHKNTGFCELLAQTFGHRFLNNFVARSFPLPSINVNQCASVVTFAPRHPPFLSSWLSHEI
jgi:hypothetical protein